MSEYVDSINAKLNQSKILRLQKIGLFTKGKEGNITFIQDKTINYSLHSFGMTNTYNKKIVRSNMPKGKIPTRNNAITNYKFNSKNLEEATIESLIKDRNEARRNKNFEMADSIRKKLKEKGIEIEDTSDGTVWRSN